MRILLLGASGLLGQGFVDVFSKINEINLFPVYRDNTYLRFYDEDITNNYINEPNILGMNVIEDLLEKVQPDIVINCIGLTPHTDKGKSKELLEQVNVLWPKKLHLQCIKNNIRFVHISSDCVFNGKRGMYTELDKPNAITDYGISKSSGEFYSGNSVVIRSSIIGHEQLGKRGLLEWFLSQKRLCLGYNSAIFSGFPSIIFAQIVYHYILKNSSIKGLFHVSSEPITKYNLLKLIASIYKKKIKIVADDSLKIDRSLDSSKFSKATKFQAEPWPAMIEKMRELR